MLSPSVLYLALLTSPALAGSPPPLQPKVPPKTERTKLDNFTWSDPFTSPQMSHFDAACESSRTFAASEFQLHDLGSPEPLGLKPYSEALKALFGGRPYPGDWAGFDAHGYERNLLSMEYRDVPVKVKEWIEDQERTGGPGKGLFAVFDRPAGGEAVPSTADLDQDDLRGLDDERVVIFAPGAVYENIPLWVADGSDCEDSLSDLSSYSPELVDRGVVGWTTGHTSPSRREGLRKMKFSLRARVLSAKSGDPTEESTQPENEKPVEADLKDEL